MNDDKPVRLGFCAKGSKESWKKAKQLVVEGWVDEAVAALIADVREFRQPDDYVAYEVMLVPVTQFTTKRPKKERAR